MDEDVTRFNKVFQSAFVALILCFPVSAPDRLDGLGLGASPQAMQTNAGALILGSYQRFYDTLGQGRPDQWVKAEHNVITVHRMLVPNGPIDYRENQVLRNGMIVQILTERLSEDGAWRITERRSVRRGGDMFEPVRFGIGASRGISSVPLEAVVQ